MGDDVISRSGISYLMTSLGDNSPTLQVYEAVTLVLMTTGHKEVIFLNRLQWQNVLTKFHKKIRSVVLGLFLSTNVLSKIITDDDVISLSRRLVDDN